jgi:transcriptional regulator with XRE-family HTH domain
VNINLRTARAIQLLREQRGWSQADLDDRMCWPKKKTWSVEAGKLAIGLEMLSLIAAAFGMAAWELLRFADRLQETVICARTDTPPLRPQNWRAA